MLQGEWSANVASGPWANVLAKLDRRSFEILRLQAERAQGLMLIPGRVVPGRGLVLERPPPCIVLGTRGLLNAPLSDTPYNVLHTRGGPRALLGPFALLADVHQGTIACDRHLACEVRS